MISTAPVRRHGTRWPDSVVEVREMMCVNLRGLSELELPAWG